MNSKTKGEKNLSFFLDLLKTICYIERRVEKKEMSSSHYRQMQEALRLAKQGRDLPKPETWQLNGFTCVKKRKEIDRTEQQNDKRQ